MCQSYTRAYREERGRSFRENCEKKEKTRQRSFNNSNQLREKIVVEAQPNIVKIMSSYNQSSRYMFDTMLTLHSIFINMLQDDNVNDKMVIIVNKRKLSVKRV